MDDMQGTIEHNDQEMEPQMDAHIGQAIDGQMEGADGQMDGAEGHMDAQMDEQMDGMEDFADADEEEESKVVEVFDITKEPRKLESR